MKRYCMSILLVCVLGGTRAGAEGYTLWDPSIPVPPTSAAPLLSGVEFHIIKAYEPQVDGYKWLHGGSIIRHEGTWYTTWGHNPGSENTATEVTQGRRSNDDFQTLTPVEMIAPGTATDANSHGVTLSHQGDLWGFFGRFTGFRQDCRTEAYKLNETTDQWESQGIVIGDGFWACQEPRRMDNGNYIMSGFRMGVSNGNPPAVAISNGDDLMDWTMVSIPKDPGLNMWGESSVIAHGNNLINIARADGSDTWAYVSTSDDYGQTWSQTQRSNLPMVATKPYAGTLSTGQDYLISTTTADSGNNRRPLTIAVTDPGGGEFKEIYRIRNAVRPGETATTSADLAYPYAVEEDGNLYVVYSVGRPGNAKNSLELAVVPVSSITPPDPANAGLVAFYDFEGDLTDSSGNGLNGGVMGTTAFSTTVPSAISSRSTKSLDLDGAGFAWLPLDFYFTAQSTGASISMWVRAAAQDEKYLFSETSSSDNTPVYGIQCGDAEDGMDDHLRFFHRTDDGTIRASVYSTSSIFASSGSQVYHHIVLTDDAGDVTIYFDGVADATDFDYTPGTLTVDKTTIGALRRTSTGFYLTGQVDEAAFFNYALDQQEVSLLAAGTDPAVIPEPSSLAIIGLGLLSARRRRRHTPDRAEP